MYCSRYIGVYTILGYTAWSRKFEKLINIHYKIRPKSVTRSLITPLKMKYFHCVKRVFSGPYFPAFRKYMAPVNQFFNYSYILVCEISFFRCFLNQFSENVYHLYQPLWKFTALYQLILIVLQLASQIKLKLSLK